MTPDDFIALQEEQRAFYEKAQRACMAFLEKHGVCPRCIGVNLVQRRVDLLHAIVLIETGDTRYTVPWSHVDGLADDDMLLREPTVGVVTLKDLGLS